MSDLDFSTYKMDASLYLKYLMSSDIYDSSSYFTFIVLGKLT